MAVTEKGILLSLDSCGHRCAKVMEKRAVRKMFLSLHAVYNGDVAMSQDINWLVETSTNLASIHVEGDKVVVTTSQRSSIGSACRRMASVVRAALGGAEVLTNEGYPVGN